MPTRASFPRWLRFAFAVALTNHVATAEVFAANEHAHHATALGDFSQAQPESTRRMAQRFREILEAEDSIQNPFRFDEKATALANLLGRAKDRDERAKLTGIYANVLLRAGRSEEAIAVFEEHERLLHETGTPITASIFTMIQRGKGMSYLRLGEQENCLAGHNADSCLLPIRGGGVHQLTRGSQGAVREFTKLLERYPGDLGARWLLNIAHMTLGEYPDKMPARWRIDPRVFESDHDIKRFPDVAGVLGLDVDDLAGGVVMDDFDRDGFLDLMVSASGPQSQLRYFRSNGDGTFTDRTRAAGLAGLCSGLNLIHADYNNDGFVDVLVLRGGWLGEDGRHPDSLLENHGNGTFTDVTEKAGLLSLRPGQTAAWFDYNGDGWLDLFFGNETQTLDAPHPCELFRNNGDGTFTECAAENGVAFKEWIKAVVTGDFNNDGRPDLYLSRRDGANRLLRNDGAAAEGSSARGRWRFTDVAAAAGVTEPFGSFSAWFWDFDNDGWLDLACAGYMLHDSGEVAADYLGLPHMGERFRVYRNRGDGTFADVSRAYGLDKVIHMMGGNFGDLDNDGWLDFYAGTGDPELTTLIPNRMFRNDAGRRFQDVTTSGGFGQLQKGHGIAFGDIDNDGDQDVYSVVGGAILADNYRNQLFANPGHSNNWLTVELEGVRSNRDAHGARIKVVARAPGSTREIHRFVGSGGSFGASPLRQEIGLGAATAVERVEIMWPASGTRQVITGLEPNRRYHIREGAPQATPVSVRTFQLPSASEAAAHQHSHSSGHGHSSPMPATPAPAAPHHHP